MAEEMKKENVVEDVKVEETKTDEVEELKKLLAEAKGLLEKENKPQEEKKEEPKGFFGKAKKYFTETSVRDFACDAAKVGGGLLLGAGALFGGKWLYDNKVKPKQIPGETYVPSEVVDNDTLE